MTLSVFHGDNHDDDGLDERNEKLVVLNVNDKMKNCNAMMF